MLYYYTIYIYIVTQIISSTAHRLSQEGIIPILKRKKEENQKSLSRKIELDLNLGLTRFSP